MAREIVYLAEIGHLEMPEAARRETLQRKPQPGLANRLVVHKEPHLSFQSAVPYDRARIHAAAIYCSDGRVGEQFDDFLQNGLQLPRYDRVALPGGPACLADHPQAHMQAQGVVDELKFLVEVHGLRRIVLIAHEGCAFYTTRLELKDRRLEILQRADLVRAAAAVRRITSIETVEGYYAHHVKGGIAFEPIEV